MIIIITYLFFTFLVTIIIYRKQFNKRIKIFPNNICMNNINEKLINFNSAGNKLKGYFYWKKHSQVISDKIIIFVNGYGVTHESYNLEIRGLVEKNYLVFSYDMTGCGESKGKSLRGFSQFIIDAESAVDYVNSLNMSREIVLCGHSVGGFATAALLNKNKCNITKAIVISAFNFPPSFVYMTMKRRLKIFAYPMKIWIFIFEKIKFGDFASYKAISGIKNFSGPILIIQGENDSIVPYHNSLFFMSRKFTKIQLILEKNAGHYPTRIRKENVKELNENIFYNIKSFIE